MFTMIMLLQFGPGPGAPPWKPYRVQYETAEECLAARDWWIAHRDAEPPGWDARWWVAGLPDCFDRRGRPVVHARVS